MREASGRSVALITGLLYAYVHGREEYEPDQMMWQMDQAVPIPAHSFHSLAIRFAHIL